MKIPFIRNEPRSATERAYTGLSLAHALSKKDTAAEITVFLMADAVSATKAGQKTPDGYYNIERKLKRVVAGKDKVLLCGTCMDARGLDDIALMEGALAARWMSLRPPR